MKLDQSTIQSFLEANSSWKHVHTALSHVFTFADYISALDFVNDVAALAIESDHHPDIVLKHNEVHVFLATHDSGGVTQKDLDMAEEISEIYEG